MPILLVCLPWIGAILGFVFGIAVKASFGLTMFLFFAGLTGGYFFSVGLRKPCPKCSSKSGRRWRFERVDGGPDRRYHDNELICRSCAAGWPRS
jgi:hypothetical protein